jgi:hypothetical protein
MFILKKEFRNLHKVNILNNKDINKSFIKRNNPMHYPSSIKE